jgi:GNAT superfamily N-acetyltransferase
MFSVADATDSNEDIPKYIGFIFIRLMTVEEIPPVITSIFTENNLIANLNHFYIFPNFRHQGLAWEFFDSIIQFVIDNHWDVAWESDARNTPANTFYNHLMEKIKEDPQYETNVSEYENPLENDNLFYYYQIKLQSTIPTNENSEESSL